MDNILTMLIKNKKQLATTKMRKQALELAEIGIKSVLPSVLMKQAISFNKKQKLLKIQNKTYKVQGRIFVIGGGKASGLMAQELEKIIGVKNITAGVINCNSTKYKTSLIKIIKASHPIPTISGVRGVKKMLALKGKFQINKDDIVLCLISGGGSALMPYPAKGVSLQDKQKITKLLLASGADIMEINAVRKHLSRVKGGQLGKFFAPAKVISLIISDVVGNDLKTIASGPTVADNSTFQDAYKVLKKYKLLAKAPKNVIKVLKQGRQGTIDETAKKLTNCYNYIIGDNKLALQAIAGQAKKLSLRPLIISAQQVGNPEILANIKAKELMLAKYKAYDVIIIGGETTPKLPAKSGRGGRNQHYALATILSMKDYLNNWCLVSINTDGSDFLANVAGAIVDNNSLSLVKNRGLKIRDYLARFDSNTLLKKIDNSLILMNNTGTNVGDIIVYVLE